MRPFRDHHLLLLLDKYDEQSLPLDVCMAHYFRANKAAGSKDRAYIAETAYAMVRQRALLDHLGEATWEGRLTTYQSADLSAAKDDASIPLHIRCSFPKPLFDMLVDSMGEESTVAFCLASNEPAPTTVRVNSLKANRDELLSRWKDDYQVRACSHSPSGIVFEKKVNFYVMPEFKQGFFEVQDEASQQVAAMVEATPGDHVLDYCAGSGGKTLAFAPILEGKGQIYLHDIRWRALKEAKVRLKRAGIQNAQTLEADQPQLKKLKKRMDWVLVDAPCSGTGTLRRNPDMKWKFEPEMVQRLVGEQRTIFERALSYVKPEGRIVYATCSVLADENDRQVTHFLNTYPSLELVGEPFRTTPTPGAADGFFAASFRLKG